jgi:hypothetical protein
MNRITIILLLVFAVSSGIFAQDIITLKSGIDLKAGILKLTPKEVIVIRENSFDTSYLMRDEISTLHYRSGITIYLQEDVLPVMNNDLGNDSLVTLGQTDASRYYKGYKPAAIATMISSLSFPFGLIPAIACSATRPSMKNLGYKDPTLMESQSYYEGYTKTAHKIKKKKVWSGFAIGSGAWIVCSIVIGSIAISTW